MINTYNESELHKTLKQIYSLEKNGKPEQKVGNFICDILTEENEIIEIQTSNISALKQKIRFAVENEIKITIVHPVISEKTIELYDEENNLISKRKSPKSCTVYTELRQLTGIYDLLTDKNFTLEMLYVNITEKRKKTLNPEQLLNKSRRHLKRWIPEGKRLNEIIKKEKFRTCADYTNLIPEILRGTNFTLKELKSEIFESLSKTDLSSSNKKKSSECAKILIWLLKKMRLLQENGQSGRKKLYKLI